MSTFDSIQLGDIWDSSWGYDQTNVDYYQVVAKKGKSTVTLRQVRARRIDGVTSMDSVAPIVDDFFGEPFDRRVKLYDSGPIVRIESYAVATPWDGKANYQTASGWGH